MLRGQEATPFEETAMTRASDDAVADRRAVLRHRAAVARRPVRGRRTARRARSGSTGSLLDGAGDPVPDALIETWQADPDGRFNHPDDPRGAAGDFRGFGRAAV